MSYYQSPDNPNRVPFELIDPTVAKTVNITMTPDEFRIWLNKQGWTMNEWANEAYVRSCRNASK